MKKWVTVVVFLLPAVWQVGSVVAQSVRTQVSNHYFSMFSGHNSTENFTDFNDFLDHLEIKRIGKNDSEFLRYVFARTHKKFLKSYESDADFVQLFQDGDYNCLTGTALYAILLNHFGFDFTVMETNYHIFLLVNSKDGLVLFEATDPQNGYLTNAELIAKRISRYKENQPANNISGKSFYHYSFKLYNEVTLDQLAGLLYYNEAVEAFNESQVATAIIQLDKANKLYQSPRIEEFSKLVLLSVVQSKMEESVKELFVRKIQSIRKQKVPGISSTVKN